MTIYPIKIIKIKVKNARNVKERRMLNTHFPNKWSDWSTEKTRSENDPKVRGATPALLFFDKQNDFFHILDISFFSLLSFYLLFFVFFVNPEKKRK